MKIWINKSDNGFYTTLRDRDKVNKMYMTVGFQRGKEPTGDVYIEVLDMFLSCYKSQNGQVNPKLVIMDYQVLTSKEEPKETAKPSYESIDMKNTEIDDDSLPFY